MQARQITPNWLNGLPFQPPDRALARLLALQPDLAAGGWRLPAAAILDYA